MSRNNYTKELVLSNIIGSNPTGIISLNNGNPIINKNVNIVQNTAIASKESLIKAQNNEIICNIEKFETKEKLLKENIISIFLIFLILIIFLFLFVLKKNIKL